MLNKLYCITFTHKNASLEEVGQLVLDETLQKERLPEIKNKFKLEELLYIATCNRVELYFVTENEVNYYLIKQFIKQFNPALPEILIEKLAKNAGKFYEIKAVNHLLNVIIIMNHTIL